MGARSLVPSDKAPASVDSEMRYFASGLNTRAKYAGTSSVKGSPAPAGRQATDVVTTYGRSSLGNQRSMSRASRSTIQYSTPYPEQGA